MRMAGPDIVLFVVGAVLFGGATYAIVSLDGTGGSASAIGVYNVAFSTADEELVSVPAGDLRSASAEFEIDEAAARHLVSLLIAVECSDIPAGAAAPFNLQMSFAGPNGQTGEASGACGTPVEATINVAPVPEASVARGNTEDEARASFEEAVHAGEPSDAIGTWTVTVSGGRGGAPVAIPVGNPSGAVVVTAQEWQPQFTPIQR